MQHRLVLTDVDRSESDTPLMAAAPAFGSTTLGELVASDLWAAWAYVQSHDEFQAVAILVPNAVGLVPFINSQGWLTIADAQAGCERLSELLGLNVTAHSEVSFTRDDLPTANVSVFATTILAAMQGEPILHWQTGADIVQNDDSVGMLTAAQLLELMRAYEPGLPWSADVNDCDDFADDFQGWLARQGLGNASIANAGFRAYEDGAMTVNHVAMIGITRDDGVLHAWWADPWSDFIYPLTSSYMDTAATSIVINSLVI